MKSSEEFNPYQSPRANSVEETKSEPDANTVSGSLRFPRTVLYVQLVLAVLSVAGGAAEANQLQGVHYDVLRFCAIAGLLFAPVAPILLLVWCRKQRPAAFIGMVLVASSLLLSVVNVLAVVPAVQ